MKVELASTRNRIVSDLAESLRAARRAQTAADVARLDLEVTREQITVALAQFQEGRQTMRQVDAGLPVVVGMVSRAPYFGVHLDP